jgi:hypothetical protein
MSTIIEEGFLATDIEHYIRENEQQKEAELSLARDTNRLAQSMFVNLVPRGDRGLLLAALFARMLEHFQAIVFLEQRNCKNSSTALARVLLETAFSLVACVKHNDFHYKLADWDALTVKRLGESLQKVSPSGSPLSAAELEGITKQVEAAKEEVKMLRQQNKDADLTIDDDLKVWRIAQYADMEDFYHSTYSLFSSTVHSAVRNLGGHVESDESGEIRNIVWGPEQPPGYALSTGVAIMLHSMASYLALHPETDFSSQLQPLFERLRVIEEATMADMNSKERSI